MQSRLGLRRRCRKRFQRKSQPHIERPDIPHERGDGRVGLLPRLQENECLLVEHRSRGNLFEAKATGETLIPQGLCANPPYLAGGCSKIQSPIVFNASGAIVVSIVPYSLGLPVLQGWKR
jgi:hypothetical protein